MPRPSASQVLTATTLLLPSEGELCHSLTGSLATQERFLRHCYSYLKDAHLKVLKGHPSSSLSIIACCHCTLWHAAPLPPAQPCGSHKQPPGGRGPAPDPVLGLVCLVPSRWWCAGAFSALTGVGQWARVPQLFVLLSSRREILALPSNDNTNMQCQQLLRIPCQEL